MAQKLAKTPDELFGTKKARIMPGAYVDNVAGTTKMGVHQKNSNYLPTGGRKIDVPFYGAAKTKAQFVADKHNVPTAYREEPYFGPTRTSLYPGEYGVELPSKWKYKTPTEQADSMLPDELEMFIDELYDNKLRDGDAEYDLDNGRHAYFERAPFGSGTDFNITITNGDDVEDEWGEWFPIKKAREASKADLIKRIRGIK